MPPTSSASVVRRAAAGTPVVPVAASVAVDTFTTVAANGVATAVPVNAGR
ncbi:hypothetical protein [Streptomyces piniterrae]|nr:hypothetical protein [Streptomyces piniterrae]